MTGGAAAVGRDLRRALARHRVLLSAGLAAGSVATGVTAMAPAVPPSRTVVVAAHDLVPGAPLVGSDLRTVGLPVERVPAGVLVDPASAVGRVVAGPVRAGEPLTDVRLLGAALLPPGPEVATPVRVAERATAALVRPGDVVDVLSAAPDGSVAAAVVSAVRVLAVPLAEDDLGDGALLVVAATRSAAARLAAAAVGGRLSVVVHGR